MPTPPYNTPCGYCFQEWATGYDHLIPRVAGGSNRRENLYPSCLHCNQLLGSRIFSSIEAKREYVRLKLQKAGQWNPGFLAVESFRTTSAIFEPLATDSRGNGDAEEGKICALTDCQKPIPKQRAGKIYCSDACRWLGWDKQHPRARFPSSGNCASKCLYCGATLDDGKPNRGSPRVFCRPPKLCKGLWNSRARAIGAAMIAAQGYLPMDGIPKPRVPESPSDIADGLFLDRIRAVAREKAARHGSVSVCELRLHALAYGLVPRHKNSWGAVFKQPGWACVGRRASSIPSRHGSWVCVWAWKPETA